MSKVASTPGVSVIIPAYNPGMFLQAALRSILRQTFSDLEVVVVDDGSTDGRDYAEPCRIDPRVLFIRQRNGGPAVARNTGILASLAPYVAFMDADDLWEETKLACQVALMEARPESPLCYTDFSRGAEPGSRASALARYRPRRPGQAIADLLRENFICTSTVLLRRSALARSGLFDPDLRGPEDIDLWLRLADVGEFAFVDAVLAFKRDHTANLSSTPAMALEQSKLVRSLLRRWKADPGLRPLLLSRLREATMALAYAERLNGHYREARSAYARAAMLGGSPIRSLAMAGLLTLPRPILQLVPRISPARPAEARRIPAP